MAEKEKDEFPLVSPVTNYDEHPHEIPQAFNSDPREGLQAFNVGSLILADDKGSNAPERVELGQDPMIVVSEGDRNGDTNNSNKDGSGSESAKERRKRTCGLSPRIFWLLSVVLFLIVVGAAVGGGVGGSIAADNRRKAHAASVSLASAIAASASAASPSAASASAASTNAAAASASR